MTIYMDFAKNAAFEEFWQAWLKDWEERGKPVPAAKRTDYFWILSAAFDAGWAAAGGKTNLQPVTVTEG